MRKTMQTGQMLGRLESAAEATARSMLKRRDVTVIAAGSSACYMWRTKTMHVPAYSIREDATEDHVNAWRGLLDHECGHVAHTDFDAWDARLDAWEANPEVDQARAKVLGNVFDDFMIEREWCVTRPGSVPHLEATHRIVVAETGGAQACDPEFVPPGSSQPMGMFGAFAQAILRVNIGQVRIEDVHPDVRELMDLCADEIAAGVAAANSTEALDAAEAVWMKIRNPEDGEGEGEGESETENGEGEQPEGDNPQPGDGEAEGEPGEGEDEGDNPGDGDGGDGDEAGDGEGTDNGGDSDCDGEDGGDGGDSDGFGGEEGGECAPDENGEGDNRGKARKGGKPGNAGAGDVTDGETDGPGGGVGGGGADISDITAKAIGGEYGEIDANDVVSKLFVPNADCRPYTIHPTSKASDQWVTFDAKQRMEARPKARVLRESCSAAGQVLANKLRTALKSQKRTMWVGGLEEGDEIDPDGLPSLASGRYDPNIFADRFSQQHDNTFVTVLVDCSGSMGDSDPIRVCPVHGVVKQKGVKCTRKDRWSGKKCGQPLEWRVQSKAGYAAMTAMTLHNALRGCGVQHAVLGYSTCWNRKAPFDGQEEIVGVDKDGKPKRWPKWSRFNTSIATYEFVPAPGLSDDGSAMAYITGIGANCDGDSLMTAAEYMCRRARECTRMVMIVVSDGLPAGADDNDLGDAHLKNAVQRIAHAGIEVYGVGVGLGYQKKTFAEFYPNKGGSGSRAATGHVVLNNAKGLDVTVMNQLAKLLVRSNGRTTR